MDTIQVTLDTTQLNFQNLDFGTIPLSKILKTYVLAKLIFTLSQNPQSQTKSYPLDQYYLFHWPSLCLIIYLKCHLSRKIFRNKGKSGGHEVPKFKFGHMDLTKKVSGPKKFFGPVQGPVKLVYWKFELIKIWYVSSYCIYWSYKLFHMAYIE